jgi:hypothetical protein
MFVMEKVTEGLLAFYEDLEKHLPHWELVGGGLGYIFKKAF